VRLTRILVAAAAVRAVFPLAALAGGVGNEWPYLGDSAGYMARGHALASGAGYINSSGLPEIYRTPGYPAFLAALSLTGHMTIAAMAVQIALSVATVALIYALARAAGGSERLARTAAVIAAFEPALAQYATQLVSETLFTFLLAAALVVYARSAASVRAAMLAGLLASAAALVRPVGYLLPLVIAAAALLDRRDRPIAVRLRFSGVVLAVAVLALGAWHTRNIISAGYSGFSTQADRQPYMTTSAWITARETGRTFDAVRREFTASILETVGPVDPNGVEFAAEARRRGRAFIRSHFVSAILLQLEGSALILVRPAGADLRRFYDAGRPQPELWRYAVTHWPWDTARRLPPNATWLVMQTWFVGFSMASLVCGIAGVLGLRRDPSLARAMLVPLGVTGYLLIASGGYFASARFHHPLMPALCIVAAMGALRIRDGIRDKVAPCT
jgi:4-amino-4-deoxy-L-arabinose transferase-like glycosyltransferase